MRIKKWFLIFLFLLALPRLTHAQDKATKSLSLMVNSGSVAITNPSLPGGMVGLSYQATVVATGGLSPYVFSVKTGTLPAGLAIDTTTGIIAGSPTTAGSSTFAIQVADAETPMITASQSYTITIIPTLAITTTSLPAANIGVAYTTSIAATGGLSPYTFAITSGTLPTGLTLSSAGVISGTPTSAGSFSFTVTVTDSASNIVLISVKTIIISV